MTQSNLCRTALAAALTLAPFACKRKVEQTVQTPTVEEEAAAPRMASTVRMNDPQVASQLGAGFYPVEGNAWRWAARQFSVTLRPPDGAAQKGCVLELDLTVPDPVIDKLHSVTLTGVVEGNKLAPETYSKSGAYSYKRDVTPSMITGDSVKVDFSLDKAMAPSGAERRELGVVVNAVSLGPK